MSVIRQPGVLGRTTRQRVVGVGAAASATVVETSAVGLWFSLIALEARTISTAFAGMGILFCGALLRSGVFGATANRLDDLTNPRPLLTAVFLTAGWIAWFSLAEVVGGVPGVVVAGAVLVATLTVQFSAERRAFRPYSTQRTTEAVAPAALLTIGVSALLAATWFSDWSLWTEPISLEITTVVIGVEAIQIGFLVFVVFAFVAHQHRYQQVLDS